VAPLAADGSASIPKAPPLTVGCGPRQEDPGDLQPVRSSREKASEMRPIAAQEEEGAPERE